jgi:hypothetical protein
VFLIGLKTGERNLPSFFHSSVCSFSFCLSFFFPVRCRVALLMIGNSLNKEVMDHQGGGIMGPVVSKGQYDKILNIISQGKKQEGLKVLVGSDEEQAKLTAKHGEGYFITPTIFVDVPTESQLWKEEIFGPVLCIRVSDVFSCEFLFSSCVSFFSYESLLRCFLSCLFLLFFSFFLSIFFFPVFHVRRRSFTDC